MTTIKNIAVTTCSLVSKHQYLWGNSRKHVVPLQMVNSWTDVGGLFRNQRR